MDRFDAMRVFTRIVERKSFTRAADDLGLPRSSVTDAVKGLEARLGVSLNPVDSISSSTKSRVSHSERRPSARFPGDKVGSARRNIEPLQ